MQDWYSLQDTELEAVENLRAENKRLQKAFEDAVKFASASCERCPYDNKFGCERTDKATDCATAVKQYFSTVKE